MGADGRGSVGEGAAGAVGLDDQGPVVADGGGLVCPDQAGPVGLDHRRAICPDSRGDRAGMRLFSQQCLPVMCKIFLIYLVDQVFWGQVQTRVPLLRFTPFLLRFFSIVCSSLLSLFCSTFISILYWLMRGLSCVSPQMYHPYRP